jgi:hypothetical protein
MQEMSRSCPAHCSVASVDWRNRCVGDTLSGCSSAVTATTGLAVLVVLLLSLVRPCTTAADDLAAPQLEKLWTALGSQEPAAVEQAMKSLTAQPARTGPFLRQRLRRVPNPDTRLVAAWLSELDSDRFAVREKATRELTKLAEVVEPELRKTLAGSPSLEVRHRVERLLENIKAERLRPSAGRLQAIRAIEILERIGDADARRLLEVVAEGAPEAQLTTEAKAALERMVQSAGRGNSRWADHNR